MADTEDRGAPRGGTGRRITFVAATALLPLLLLGALELGVRAAGVVEETPLFVPHPEYPEYLMANREVIGRFFARPDLGPDVSVETSFFRARRDPASFRIAIQGGSSAAGFPYGYGASPAGMLEQRLRRNWPEREIEIVNTAMAAVNSYTLLDFADEIIATEPDAVLIYAGHNEFLGVFGVGSAYSSGQSRHLTNLVLWLRNFHLYRALEGALAGEPEAATGEGGDDTTLMATVAREKSIPRASSLYEQGTAQFRGNLSALLERYRRAGIPVFVASLVSNERDQPPFVSGLEPGTDGDAWEADLQRARQALEAGQAAEAVTGLRELAERDGEHAMVRYLLARALLADGQVQAAAERFREARDLDQLRFRAPGAFNDVIRELSKTHGAHFVDVEAAFRARSPDGIVGHDLITEHLHPNVDGYFVLADAFFRALQEKGLPGAGVRGADMEQARGEIPLTRSEEIIGEHKLRRLMSNWPFSDPPRELRLPAPTNVEERLAREMFELRISWPEMMTRLKDYYRSRGDDSAYLRAALSMADAFPYRPQLQYDAGQALRSAGRTVQAIRYLYQSARYRPRHTDSLLALGRAYVEAGLARPGAEVFRKVLEIDPGNADARRALRRLDGA